MNIAIIGCGVYSMAMAKRLSKVKDNTIKVWTEDEKKVKEFKDTNKVKSIFKDEIFNKNISISNNYKDVLKDADIIFLMTSANFLKSTLKEIKPFYSKKAGIIIGTKGIELETGKFFSKIVKKGLKTNNIGVIAGPSFAIDILNDEILALTVATRKGKLFKKLNNIYRETNTKLERSRDLVGVQLSSVLKNIYAIGSGIYSGMGHSESTTAIYLNKVIKEISEILYMFDCSEFTLLSLATHADMIMTCSDSKSRNYTYGTKIAKSKKEADKFLKNNTVEGYTVLETIYNLLKKKKIKAPLLYIIHDIVFANMDKKEIEKELLK
ncbi:MAG: hypothetical protein E7158_00675 [Firmicutes bacterium]|nr:hypothetical protein [Bacillota bacterium]